MPHAAFTYSPWMWSILPALIGCSGNEPSRYLRDRPTTEVAKRYGEIEVGRPFNERFACVEHLEGELVGLGDAYGSDCHVVGRTGPGQGYFALYRSTGERNDDWFGFGKAVLAPFDGVVEAVTSKSETNVPGIPGEPPASILVFSRPDGTRVLYAHLVGISVASGQLVRRGEKVGVVGNNGNSSEPHLHVGAWKDERPLRLKFELAGGPNPAAE